MTGLCWRWQPLKWRAVGLLIGDVHWNDQLAGVSADGVTVAGLCLCLWESVCVNEGYGITVLSFTFLLLYNPPFQKSRDGAEEEAGGGGEEEERGRGEEIAGVLSSLGQRVLVATLPQTAVNEVCAAAS